MSTCCPWASIGCNTGCVSVTECIINGVTRTGITEIAASLPISCSSIDRYVTSSLWIGAAHVEIKIKNLDLFVSLCTNARTPFFLSYLFYRSICSVGVRTVEYWTSTIAFFFFSLFWAVGEPVLDGRRASWRLSKPFWLYAAAWWLGKRNTIYTQTLLYICNERNVNV